MTDANGLLLLFALPLVAVLLSLIGYLLFRFLDRMFYDLLENVD